jgi:hypothetical protein
VLDLGGGGPGGDVAGAGLVIGEGEGSQAIVWHALGAVNVGESGSNEPEVLGSFLVVEGRRSRWVMWCLVGPLQEAARAPIVEHSHVTGSLSYSC